MFKFCLEELDAAVKTAGHHARLSEETVPFALHAFNRLVFITEMESVYCAVRTDSLKHIRFVLRGLRLQLVNIHKTTQLHNNGTNHNLQQADTLPYTP
jgi:hypothetical protein